MSELPRPIEPDDLLAHLATELTDDPGIADALRDFDLDAKSRDDSEDIEYAEYLREVIEAYAGDIDTLNTLRDNYTGSAYLEVNVADDIRRIRQDFDNLYAQHLVSSPDTELSVPSVAMICDQIEASTLTNLEHLNLDLEHHLVVRSPAILIDMTGEAISLADGIELHGKFASVSVGETPDILSSLTGGDEGGEVVSIACVLSEAVLIDPLDDSLSGELGPVVNVILDTPLPIVHKIVR